MLKHSVMLAIGLIGTAAIAAPPPVEVMILGTYHFGNPGLDLNNAKVDSVLTATRQAELANLAKVLATFRPTRVIVEKQVDEPGFVDAGYSRFDDAMLAAKSDETVQIGYRTARLAGLTIVNGIDEQPKVGEPDYFPYDNLQASAAKHGQTAALEATNAPVAASMKVFEAKQKTSNVAQLLAMVNDPKSPTASMESYYGVLGLGDKDDQAGADLNAMWYLRNAKIFGKLMQVAKPGAKEPERVLVVYGAGHGFWLRHFASNTPGYRNVDVRPYLDKAAK